jgi:tellurite resistance protein
MLRAVVVMALADGEISPGEKGLLKGLADRVGIGQASLDAVIDRARNEPSMRDDLFHRGVENAETALELLVGAARLDGEITDEERELLVHLMARLNVPTERFSEIYRRGIERADGLRRARSKRS